MKKLGLLLSAIFCLILYMSCGGGASDSPSKAAEAYYNAMKSGDFKKAISYSLIEDAKDQEMVVTALEGLQKEGFKVKDFKILSEDIDKNNESAKVKVEVTVIQKEGQEPQIETDELPAQKINGVWRIGIN